MVVAVRLCWQCLLPVVGRDQAVKASGATHMLWLRDLRLGLVCARLLLSAAVFCDTGSGFQWIDRCLGSPGEHCWSTLADSLPLSCS